MSDLILNHGRDAFAQTLNPLDTFGRSQIYRTKLDEIFSSAAHKREYRDSETDWKELWPSMYRGNQRYQGSQ